MCDSPNHAPLCLADGREIEWVQTLRLLPDKREVFAGRLRDQAVVVKVFLDAKRGDVHMRREADGLAAFHTAGIDAPEVLYRGADAQGCPVLVLRRIEQATTLSDQWQEADGTNRRELLERMIQLLARQHAAGICQTDVHPGNFMLTTETVYSLDGDGVVSQAEPLDRSTSLDNLALFCAQFPPQNDTLALEAASHYADRRSWPRDDLVAELPARIAAQRLRRWQKLEPKLYRECTAIVHGRSGDHEYFAQRSRGDGLRQLAGDPDTTCPTDPALMLKKGNTATVWETELDGRGVVVKRYNVKHLTHGLRLALRESRASVSWRNAHMLALFGVSTPVPLALVYGPRRRFGRVAYFIAEAVGGPDLLEWVFSQHGDREHIASMAGCIAELFSSLRAARISHGDMKATNFIVADDRLYVIDLDAMKRHRDETGFARAWQRDMRRFMANWQPGTVEFEAIQQALAPLG